MSGSLYECIVFDLLNSSPTKKVVVDAPAVITGGSPTFESVGRVGTVGLLVRTVGIGVVVVVVVVVDAVVGAAVVVVVCRSTMTCCTIWATRTSARPVGEWKTLHRLSVTLNVPDPTG